MEFLFGKKKTPQELLQENQHALSRLIRELDRERNHLEQQEWKIIANIKRTAMQGQQVKESVKIMAKDLVQTRRYMKRVTITRANIQAVAMKLQTVGTVASMAEAMKGVTKAMTAMNQQLKLPEIQKIMVEFEKQSDIMSLKEEMMNDAIDDVVGDDDDEEESDAIVAQVLDELGLQLNDQLTGLPSTGTGSVASSAGPARKSGLDACDADLEARLEKLRR